ncbi:MAG: hypothetical protein Q6370_022275 [Candidatus Sigynarchaeota archaeon]
MGYKKGCIDNVKKRITNLDLVVLYELGGFLFQAKVVTYLGKDKHVALFKAVANGKKIPSEVTISAFKKKLVAMAQSPAFDAFRSYIYKFLASISLPHDTSVDMLFPGLFAVLQMSYSYVDPDARLGYCATKKEVFLGYRVQLLIDDTKSCP